MYKKEQLKEDFVKINPQHTVPTLDDNGFILTESRAIGVYLAEKYFPEGHSLYPKDVKQRARINQLLQFDCGTLYPRIKAIQVRVSFAFYDHFSLKFNIFSGQLFTLEQLRSQMKIVRMYTKRLIS